MALDLGVLLERHRKAFLRAVKHADKVRPSGLVNRVAELGACYGRCEARGTRGVGGAAGYVGVYITEKVRKGDILVVCEGAVTYRPLPPSPPPQPLGDTIRPELCEEAACQQGGHLRAYLSKFAIYPDGHRINTILNTNGKTRGIPSAHLHLTVIEGKVVLVAVAARRLDIDEEVTALYSAASASGGLRKEVAGVVEAGENGVAEDGGANGVNLVDAVAEASDDECREITEIAETASAEGEAQLPSESESEGVPYISVEAAAAAPQEEQRKRRQLYREWRVMNAAQMDGESDILAATHVPELARATRERNDVRDIKTALGRVTSKIDVVIHKY